ncbi:MAG: LysR family transcriptional regulator [Phycisphaerales bacterium]|nr:MAG: LysR family transcriptional regulator [Phycisphaerales bacterium]
MPRVHPGPRGGQPEDEQRSSPGTWEGRLRLWIAINGRIALGPGKIRLLEAIAATKSLSAAAKQLRMSYRHAWKHVHLIEERTGITVVEPQRGGSGGGGTDLTPQGRALLKAYRSFRKEVDEQMRSACSKYFGDWSTPQVDDAGAPDSPPPGAQDADALADAPSSSDPPPG